MGRGIPGPRLAVVTLTTALALALLAACTQSDKVAGGSSGVDNPEVVVAFVAESGAAVTVTGTVSVYVADQNPAVDPDPLVKKVVTADTAVSLSALDFKGDSARAYNVLIVADDSSGSLVRDLSYDPVARKFTFDSAVSRRVAARMSPLVRYEATLERDGTDLVRVVAPGTPYQAVVVDSVFVLEGVPADDTLTLHVVGADGQERPLKDAPGGGGDKPRHRIDSAAPPIDRGPPPEPSGPLRVNAWPDRSVILGSEFALLGGVEGAPSDDPRLAVLWRQIDPDPSGRAAIETPTAPQTRVTFPWPGFYRFALSAAFGNHRVEDTVLVSVQPPPLPAFTDPNPFNPSSLAAYTEGPAFKVNWYAYLPDTLDLELSRDSGSTWEALSAGVVSNGPVSFRWNATLPVSENCFLRLKRAATGKTVAYSTLFAVRAGSPPPPPKPPGH
jgi:hypothetical protein